jgi:hypothetical protein
VFGELVMAVEAGPKGLLVQLLVVYVLKNMAIWPTAEVVRYQNSRLYAVRPDAGVMQLDIALMPGVPIDESARLATPL